jgi:IS5 family transposase
MNKQFNFSSLSDELAQAAARKKEFLAQIERIIPWSEWLGIIRPHYYSGERGNKPFELELMTRIRLRENCVTCLTLRDERNAANWAFFRILRRKFT